MNERPTSTPHLSLRGLRKSYGEHVAVDGVDLDIGAGEFVALLGPSGCGKTTLLRSIAGLVSPGGGDILIEGRSILGVPVHRRDLGMVFQSYALFPHMTVAENVAFGLRMRRLPRREAETRVARALELVRMSGLEGRYPHQLSGGQQQRVALARALVTNPAVLLLDEPLAALDAKLREAMQVELRQLQRRIGITTIFVTHDQHEALAMADRVAVMRGGRVEQFGTPTSVYENPETPFVAEFIGQMNRLSGELIANESGVAKVRLAGRAEPFDARSTSQIPPGGAVIAMMRPEKLELAPARVNGHALPNQIAAKVTETLFSGEKITFYLDTALGPLIATMQNRSTEGKAIPQVGQAIEIGWRAADALIFAASQSDR
ncbi:MAG TPA: ABC transporter ATP-binding protein [Alphaproteobacteria bacterium]|nr:ABC transporter ATP-binding protein [Alphaproteobacteria bacterium]